MNVVRKDIRPGSIALAVGLVSHNVGSRARKNKLTPLVVKAIINSAPCSGEEKIGMSRST